MGFIAWYVVPILRENYLGDYYKGTAGIVEIREWPFLAIVIVGSVATVIQYILLAARDFALAFSGRRR
jgi:hypothetical protein